MPPCKNYKKTAFLPSAGAQRTYVLLRLPPCLSQESMLKTPIILRVSLGKARKTYVSLKVAPMAKHAKNAAVLKTAPCQTWENLSFSEVLPRSTLQRLCFPKGAPVPNQSKKDVFLRVPPLPNTCFSKGAPPATPRKTFVLLGGVSLPNLRKNVAFC